MGVSRRHRVLPAEDGDRPSSRHLADGTAAWQWCHQRVRNRFSRRYRGPVPRISSPLEVATATPGVPRLLSVHAHPDDEASKGAGTVAKYVSAGAEAVLVTCTGGEEGEVLNPALDRPDVRDNLAEVRRGELLASAAAIGYGQVVLLGYRDSGMPDSEANARPEAFANVAEDEAVERLVRVIRATRPHVVITYGDDQQGYPHPDHLRVHDISLPAFDLSADGRAFPDAGPPWQPLKLYYSEWSLARIKAMHDKFLELGRESPFDDRWFARPSRDAAVTTRVDTLGFAGVRRAALTAHATQVDPTSAFWFGLSDEEQESAYHWDDFTLARSHVATDTPEHDLFAGIANFV